MAAPIPTSPRHSGGDAASETERRVASDAPLRPQDNRPLTAAHIAKAVYWLVLVATVAVLASGRRLTTSADQLRPHDALVNPSTSGVSLASVEAASIATEQTPVFVRYFFETIPDAPSVHASTIALLPDGGLVAAWFGGSREGAKDVAIYASNWDSHSGNWEPVRKLSDRSQSSRELGRYVKKLGNPVLHCDRRGRLWLYYVTVSVGGWSGGSISVKHSDDQGRSWSDARRVIAAPFLNTCNLVRAAPVDLDDGGVLLPTYHEFLYQFGELLHLDPDGQLVNKYRMNAGLDSLQPALVARSSTEVLAYHRRGGASQPKVLFNRSVDAGQTWSPIQALELPNPNASVAAAATQRGDVLMAFNPSETGREQLALAISPDGEDWRMLTMLEDGEAGQEFSYPSLIRGRSGIYHLSYTWDRTRICHVMFNEAWLETDR